MSRLAPEDSELLGACLRGDKSAWDLFIERYSKLVYWSIWKALEKSPAPDRHEACREAFQDFFKRILEPTRMRQLAAATSPRKYLQVMAGRLVFERFRRADVIARLEVPSALVEEPELLADPKEEMVRSERAAILEGVLGSLKPNERTCLELFYLEGFSYLEIAGRLGLTDEAVSSILRRTKEKAKEKLKKRGLDSDS